MKNDGSGFREMMRRLSADMLADIRAERARREKYRRDTMASHGSGHVHVVEGDWVAEIRNPDPTHYLIVASPSQRFVVAPGETVHMTARHGETVTVEEILGAPPIS